MLPNAISIRRLWLLSIPPCDCFVAELLVSDFLLLFLFFLVMFSGVVFPFVPQVQQNDIIDGFLLIFPFCSSFVPSVDWGRDFGDSCFLDGSDAHPVFLTLSGIFPRLDHPDRPLSVRFSRCIAVLNQFFYSIVERCPMYPR
jgi:hypothetical protein